MITDNEWHDGILAEHTDGSFGIYDDLNNAKEYGAGKFHEEIKYEPIEYNWNKGQPLIQLPYGEVMSIVDTGLEEGEGMKLRTRPGA